MKRFGALRFVASFYRVLAWLSLVGGILFGLATMIVGIAGGRLIASAMPELARPTGGVGMFESLVLGLLIILGSILYFVFLYAVADGIGLGLAIEENTREVAVYLREQR